MSLTERENALRILSGKDTPEWIPDTDECFATVFSSAVHERPAIFESGDDWFGCHWHWDAPSFGHAPDLTKPMVLDDVTEWESVVKFPDIEAIDWKAAAEKDLAEVDREQKVLRLFMESGPFERSHHLMGFENAFVSLMEEPEAYKALIDRIADYKVALIHKFAEFYHPDEIFFQDDMASAQGLFMSLDTYHELIKPAHKRIGDAIREEGIYYTHHSCGKMQDLIPDFIDNGVSGLNPLQPLNDHAAIVKKYGDQVYFIAGPDGSINSPGVAEEKIRNEMDDLAINFGPTDRFIYHIFMSNVSCIPRNPDIAKDEIARINAGQVERVNAAWDTRETIAH